MTARKITYELKLKNIKYLLYGKKGPTELGQKVRYYTVRNEKLSDTEFLLHHFGRELLPGIDSASRQCLTDLMGRDGIENPWRYGSVGFVKGFCSKLREMGAAGTHPNVDVLVERNKTLFEEREGPVLSASLRDYIVHIREAEVEVVADYRIPGPQLDMLLGYAEDCLTAYDRRKNPGFLAMALSWLLIGALARTRITDLSRVLEDYREALGWTEAGAIPKGLVPGGRVSDADEDPAAGLCQKLRTRLEEERDSHPSFQLMNEAYGLDRELVPKGSLLIPVSGRGAELDDGDRGGAESDVDVDGSKGPGTRTLADFIRESREPGRRKHVTIEGEGGIGKTVALLSLALEPGVFPDGIPVIYVPLHRLNQERFDPKDGKGRLDLFIGSCLKKECRCTDRETDAFLDLCRQDGPGAVLLLDGYNEVLEGLKRQVRGEINEWAAYPGVQIITTSRTPWSCGDDFMKIRLRPLDEDTIRRYLERAGAEIPRPGDSLWRVIDYPLMLTLYTHISAVRRQAGKGLSAGASEGTPDMSRLSWRPMNKAGDIIWNYLQKELAKCAGELDVETDDGFLEACAVAVLHTTPYIAWRMSREDAFSIPLEEDEGPAGGRFSFSCLVRESLSCLGETKDWSGQLKRIIKKQGRRRTWMRLAEDPDSDKLFDRAELIERLLLNEISLFRIREDTGINETGAGRQSEDVEMMHQQFRDGLAAVWLAIQADNINLEEPGEDGYALPEAWREEINYYTLKFTADMMQEEAVQKVWEAGRIYQPEHFHVAYTMMNLVKERSGKKWIDLREEKLDGMDFSKITLSKTVLAGMKLGDTKFSDESFMSDFNNRIQITLQNGKTFLITSDSEEMYNDLKKIASSKNRIVEISGRVNNKTDICNYGELYLDSYDHLYPLKSLVSWNVKIDIVRGSYDRCYDFDFSYDGKYIWGRYDNDIIRIWDIKTRRCINIMHIPGLSTMCIHTLDDIVYADKNGNICYGDMNGSFSVLYHEGSLRCTQIKWSDEHKLFYGASNRGIYSYDPLSKNCSLCCACAYPIFNVYQEFLICYNNISRLYVGNEEGLRGSILTVYKMGNDRELIDISLNSSEDEDIMSPTRGEMKYYYFTSRPPGYYKWFIDSRKRIEEICCSTDNTSVWYKYYYRHDCEITVDEELTDKWQNASNAPNKRRLKFTLKGNKRRFLAKDNLFGCLNEGKIVVVKGNKINDVWEKSEENEFVALNLNVNETDFRNSYLNCTEKIKSLLRMNGAIL